MSNNNNETLLRVENLCMYFKMGRRELKAVDNVSFDITTGNFDLIDLGDYRSKIGYENPQYYYRPRKNIVNRPVSCGGKGWHFCGDHQETIPNLYEKLTKE